MKRAKNYEYSEIKALLYLTKRHSKVLEKKSVDSFSNKEKFKAWKAIEAEFVKRTGMERSWEGLRTKYNDLKKTYRRKLAASEDLTEEDKFLGSFINDNRGYYKYDKVGNFNFGSKKFSVRISIL